MAKRKKEKKEVEEIIEEAIEKVEKVSKKKKINKEQITRELFRRVPNRTPKEMRKNFLEILSEMEITEEEYKNS